MDWNTIQLIVLVLVLCCGPMLFMMGKRGDKSAHAPKTQDQNRSDQP